MPQVNGRWGAKEPTTVSDGSITTAKLADNAVTSAKTQDDTLTNADIANLPQPAQADLAGTALLGDVIIAHNALLAKLRTAGIITP